MNENILTLPDVSAHDHPADGRLIFVMRCREGYWEKEAVGVVDDALTADQWNEAHNISKTDAEAMFVGSMFGWDSPAANPDNWNEDGTLKCPINWLN
jgi:hypothetical protein